MADIRHQEEKCIDERSAEWVLSNVELGSSAAKASEFNVAGRIFPGWDIIANYAYIDARVTKDC